MYYTCTCTIVNKYMYIVYTLLHTDYIRVHVNFTCTCRFICLCNLLLFLNFPSVLPLSSFHSLSSSHSLFFSTLPVSLQTEFFYWTHSSIFSYSLERYAGLHPLSNPIHVPFLLFRLLMHGNRQDIITFLIMRTLDNYYKLQWMMPR